MILGICWKNIVIKKIDNFNILYYLSIQKMLRITHLLNTPEDKNRFVTNENWFSNYKSSVSRYGYRGTELPLGDLFVVSFINSTKREIYTKEEFERSDYVWDKDNCITIGIPSGRSQPYAIRYLESNGFTVSKSFDHERCMDLCSDNYIFINKTLYRFKYLVCKPRDMPTNLKKRIIDMAITYSDIWYTMKEADFNIKPLKKFVDEMNDDGTYLSLICDNKDEIKEKDTIRIVSEYTDAERLLNKIEEFTDKKVQIEYVSGSAESYVIAKRADLAITIVQTGETLAVNNLKEYAKLRKVEMNIWTYVDPFSREMFYYDLYESLREGEYRKLILEGIDGTGKSSIIKMLQKNKDTLNVLIYDRHKQVTKKTLTQIDRWDDMIELSDTIVVVIDDDLDLCDERLKERETMEKYEQRDAQSYFKLKYRELSAYYGFNVLPEKMSLDDKYQAVVSILNGDKRYKLPAMKSFEVKDTENLKVIALGESKKVMEYNEYYDIIMFLPSVYSHKMQRGGFIKDSDQERYKTTRNMLYLLAKSGIQHTYWLVYNGFILAERIRDTETPDGIVKNPPPVEVCVKGFHIGTHKHIYYGMQKYLNRHGEKFTNQEMEYSEPIVRFDWRNPNHVNQEKDINSPYALIYTNAMRKSGLNDSEIKKLFDRIFPDGIPMGDYAMCDELADRFIDVEKTKDLARKAFNVLSGHFLNMNIRFKDVCFMITTDGKKIFGEVSQDCGRYEKIDVADSLDKDVWRAGGSSVLVLEKWRRLSQLVDDYTRNHISEWQADLFKK